MLLALIASVSLLASVEADVPQAPAEVRQAYQDALAKAGRSSDDQVRLALWCEAHGLTAERLHHLTLAVLADPKNATARGLMGLVSREGRWQRPEAVADKLKADPVRTATLLEYESRRQKAAYTADAQWSLGLWAEENGLAEQAKAHLSAVIRLDPSRELAWKKLGYKKHEGRWVTDAQLAREKADQEAQKLADKKWKSALERSRAMLEQPSKRREAESALAEVTDPRAVPMIMQVFATSRAADQLRAAQILGQVDSPAASRSLAGLAVLSSSAEVRRVAVETLRLRDPRDFVRLWIALIRKPIKFEVKPVGGPGSPGTLFVEGEKANLRRVYSPSAMPNVPILPGTRLSYDANGLPVLNEPIGRVPVGNIATWTGGTSYSPAQVASAYQQATQGGKAKDTTATHPNQAGRPASSATGATPFLLTDEMFLSDNGSLVTSANTRVAREIDLSIPVGQMMVEAQRSAQSSQQQLASDVAELEKVNASVRSLNEPTLHALGAVTGKDLGDNPAAWSKWWTDQQGYVFAQAQTTDKPTIVEDVPSGYTPMTVPQVTNGPLVNIGHSCFAAGTSVRTIDGDRPIESVRPGDLVLVQDIRTGALGYQAVVNAYHNPPSTTWKVKLGRADDPVVATAIHRFWKVGQGWTMTRDLKAGDLVRTLGGVAEVSAVDPDRVQPVFNLEVGEGHNFLVGKLGALVHDNSLIEPTPDPFDAPAPALAARRPSR